MMVQDRPEYSRTQVNAAGATLIDPASSLNDLRRARAIVNNWRAAHSLPLDRIRMELQERVAPLGEEVLVAQRLKRLSSIVAESWPDGAARVRWNEYAGDEREEAIRAFEEVEAATEHFPGAETVLVRVASVDSLRSAYPSYFADTRVFVAEIEKAIG